MASGCRCVQTFKISPKANLNMKASTMHSQTFSGGSTESVVMERLPA